MAALRPMTQSAFWLESYAIPAVLHPFHGVSATKGELALTWGVATLFMFVPLAFYRAHAQPHTAWQALIFYLTNLYIASSAIVHTTEGTDAFWADRDPRSRQLYVLGNGLALVLLVVALPGSLALCLVTFLFSTATAIATGACPRKLAKPVATAGAAVTIALALATGAASAAAPACVLYVVLITLSFSPLKSEGLADSSSLP